MESNHRHRDFQSLALPTELQSQMAVPTRIELAIFCVTGRRDNRYTTGPIGCGGWIWTNGLRVMSPTSYQTAPLRDIKNINGGERGIRTPAPFPTSRFSRPVPSTRLGYFSTSSICHPRRQMNYIITFFLMSTHFQRKAQFFHKKSIFSHSKSLIWTYKIKISASKMGSEDSSYRTQNMFVSFLNGAFSE